MTDKPVEQAEAKKKPTGKNAAPRRIYIKPQLEKLGDLRTVTLGGSQIGTGDSGGASPYEWRM